MSGIKEKTLKLIDGLKATCQSYGMGNDGNEYKIITQVFLYKFLNDKFGYELKNAKSEIAKKLTGDVKWENEAKENYNVNGKRHTRLFRMMNVCLFRVPFRPMFQCSSHTI